MVLFVRDKVLIMDDSFNKINSAVVRSHCGWDVACGDMQFHSRRISSSGE